MSRRNELPVGPPKPMVALRREQMEWYKEVLHLRSELDDPTRGLPLRVRTELIRRLAEAEFNTYGDRKVS